MCLEFANEIGGGAVPKEYIKPVEQGMKDGMEGGRLAGYEMIDVRVVLFFFQAEDGIRDLTVTGVQTCALPICPTGPSARASRPWTARGGLPRVVHGRDARADGPVGHARLSGVREGIPDREGREIGRASCRERV